MTSSDELNLLLCLLLTAAVFYSSLRFSRQFADGSVAKAMADAVLLFALIVYLSVVIPGSLHYLNFGATAIVALAGSTVLLVLSRSNRPPLSLNLTPDRWIALAATLFATGYLLAYTYDQRPLPPVATDALVYQLSMPIDWIRHHSLSIAPTWYWNPANSYAPAGPAAWFVWLLLPLKNDVLARFAQAPAVLWIFLLVYRGFSRADGGRLVSGDSLLPRSQHGRDARATSQVATRTTAKGIAACVACAAVLSRPIFSEALFAKDDLIVTALFLTTLLAFRRDSLRDRFGPWRMGIALGLTLATKYTVLLVCPLLLFVVDAPFRAGWKRRDFATALLIAVALAGPWYLRNLLVAGDPLFPADVKLLGIRLFTGLFGTEHDQSLRAAGGIRHMLAETYHSLPLGLLIALAITWLAACVAAGRSLLTNPLRRAALLGSAATLLLFLVASPHHEVRYLFPLIVLWFDSATLAISRWIPTAGGKLAAAVLLAAISTATSFDITLLHRTAQFAGFAGAFAASGIALALLLNRWPKFALPAGGLLLLAAATEIYIDWHAYLNKYRNDTASAWTFSNPDEAPAWQFIRDETQVPADANVAFANTQFTYPLYGFHYQRDVAYAPTRRGLHSFLEFPRMGDDVPGDLIVATMTRVMTEDPDRQTWLDNLHALGSKYLVVFRRGMVEHPVELEYAESDPAHFVRRYDDDFAVVYEIRR
jgi:hypothetical protein